MKYKKPYYETGRRLRPIPPLIMLEMGLSIFLKAFEQEIKDAETWKKHTSLSHLIMDRSLFLFWNDDRVTRVRKVAKPFIALLEEAYKTDSQETLKIFDGLHNSYSEIQHSAYTRVNISDKGDYVKKFNLLFDDYTFRYEELLNRLVSISYACTEIVLKEEGIMSWEEYLALDSNKKVRRLQASLLPADNRYEKIPVIVEGIKPGIRNALSHGGRRTQLDEEESFLLEDSSGWSQKFTLSQFKDELSHLNDIVVALEYGLLVFAMNHIKELSDLAETKPKHLTDGQRSQVLNLVAQDCQFEVISAESGGEHINIKLRFTPIQPRNSEVFGEWGGLRFHREEAPRLVNLKNQTLRFVHIATVAIAQDTPGVRIEVYDWRDKILAKLRIDLVGDFRDAVSDLSGKEDVEGKKKVEEKYVHWERLAWAVGEKGRKD